MIQGFNFKGHHAIGMIHIKLVIDDLSTFSIFHVIDAKASTSYYLGGHASVNTGLLLPLSINV